MPSLTLFISLVFLMLGGILLHPVKTLAAPPTDFETLPIVTTGLNNPTAIEFAPDGRLFILEQNGTIKIYKNGQLLSRFFDELPAFGNSDRGLLGIAFDPDFNTNHFVYFYYITLDSEHMIVRFDASEDIAQNGPVTIWRSGVVAGPNHAGGTIQFGSDGKLYIGIGDGNNPNDVQNVNSPFGKILRINKDGTIPSDNPFSNATWAYGLRNPFRFQFDSQTGNLYVGDVGNEKWEELNRIVKGGNYGWPIVEGQCTTNCDSFINPLYTYLHATPSFSITGGFVYHGTQFPSQYQNRYFFGDYAQGFIKYLTFNNDGTINPDNVLPFDPSAGSVVDLKVAPDGSVYYVTIFPGKIFRIKYTQGNKTPIAKALATPASGIEPLSVQFSSSGSSDPDGNALTYLWDFGDGTTSTEPNPSKNYSNVGKYQVRLTISDGTLNAESIIEVSVGTPPNISITSPNNDSTYKAGDTISYSLTAQDANGQDLPDSAVDFEVLFHHDTHIHPFLRPINQKTGSFTIPTTGETSANTWYELEATATDTNGLTQSKSIIINPQKTNFTLQTDPSGYQIALDGTPITTPITIQGVVGFQRQLDAPNQNNNGSFVEFDSWSDGGAKKHLIRLPENPTTYTAKFKPLTPFRGEYFNNPTFSGSPVFTKDDPIINFSWGSSSPDSRIPNDQFSVRWTKQQFFGFGRYKLTGFSDDGIRVYLDNNLVLDGWSFNRGVSNIIDISEGIHTLRVDYREDGGGADVGFSWDLTPDQPTPLPSATPTASPIVTPSLTPTPTATPSPPPTSPSPDSFLGEYFSNQNLIGPPTITRSDPIINFIWNENKPDPALPKDQFSVRWTKTETVTKGIYRFTVSSDDGVRLYVDGQRILDRWIDQPQTTYSVDHYLSDGPHTIILEYYEAFGGAIIQLQYQKAPDTFKAEYFSNINLTGQPTVIREDAKINYAWNKSSPDSKIPNDLFSARWTKTQYFSTSKQYSFTIQSDDGVRFWIDDQLIIDDWTDHGMKTYTPKVNLSAGVHIIKIEYYENKGGAVMTYNQNN